jgi:excisionase family DNA binding protein
MVTTARPAFTVQDIAKILNMEVHAIYRHIRLGTIPYFRVGASIRFDPDKFETWYKNQQIG